MTSSSNPFIQLCRESYSLVKAQHPSDGRRKIKLRIAERFWQLSTADQNALTSNAVTNILTVTNSNSDFLVDPDPFDEYSKDAPEIGILIRTDYMDEDAWQHFVGKLRDSEKDFHREMEEQEADVKRSEAEHQPTGISISEPPQDDAMDEDDGGESSSSDEDSVPIFNILNPPFESPLRSRLTSISNLTALRLFNDISIRLAPLPPTGTPRMKPPNRLADQNGWQEAYTGKTLWIYDTKSNEDGCVRLIEKEGPGEYGTATGDSWRARVNHICELQVNMYAGAMTINFGGLDRWDYPERLRNTQEAHSYPI